MFVYLRLIPSLCFWGSDQNLSVHCRYAHTASQAHHILLIKVLILGFVAQNDIEALFGLNAILYRIGILYFLYFSLYSFSRFMKENMISLEGIVFRTKETKR